MGILGLLYFSIDHFDLLVKDIYPIEYLTYQNINVRVEKDFIKGKVNKKHFLAMDNECYFDNCGFPKAGDYKVSEIKFIKITEKYTFTKTRSYYYLLESCLNNLKYNCFKNVPDNFVANEKIKIVDRAKNEIEWTIEYIIVILIGGFIDDRIYEWKRKKLSR